MHTWKIEYIT